MRAELLSHPNCAPATRTAAGSTTNDLWDRQAGLPELIDDGMTVYLQTGGDVQSNIAKSNNAATYDLLDGQGSVWLQTGDACLPPEK